MKHPVRQYLGLCIFATGLLLGSSSFAEQKTLHDGVFTAEQSQAGASVYEASCKTCHDMKFYANTLKSWNSQPLIYLWETIMGTMPADNPGSLMFEEYTNVLAYILAESGFPAGDVPLDQDQGMDTIKIVTP